MCSILLVICFFSGLTWISAEVLFSIEQLNDNSLSCKQTPEKPGKTFVLENDDIKLSVIFEGRKQENSPGINYFQCIRKNEPKYIFVKNPEKSPRNSVTSIKATKEMSGLWECKILTNKGVGIKPMIYDPELKGNFTQLLCHVNVHVRLLETPQIVLVNNMILPTKRMDYTEEDVDHSAEYNYLNGDIVTVACIPGSDILKEITVNRYTIEFQYNYAETLDNMFKEQKNIRSELGYGFHTKLQARHHNTVMICKCYGQDDHTTIKVTFVLKQIIQSNGYITVNGLIARPLQSTKNDNSWNYQLNYLFFEDENVEIVCKSNEDLLIAAGKQEECNTGGQTFTQELKSPFEYNCLLCDVENGIVHDNIHVITKSLASDFKENKRLDADLPSDKILIELFKYDETERHSWIYYEFEEDEEVELKCTHSKDKNSVAEIDVKYIFDKEELKKSKRVTLSSEDDNKYFECLLVEAMDSHSRIPLIHKNITVLFRKRILTTTTTTTTSTSSTIEIEPKIMEGPQLNSTPEQPLPLDKSEILKWAIGAGAVLVCIVLSCVVITIWKMRKPSQRRDSGANNYENLQNQNSQILIPPYPEQWSHKEEQNYHVPVDIRNDSDIYAEPVRGPDNPYATPIPKSQRLPKGSQYDPGPTYAELNIGSGSKTTLSNFGDPQYSSVKELYSQVVPKNLRPNTKINYDNVFPDSRYVNSKNSEYVEPTYCQAFKK